MKKNRRGKLSRLLGFAVAALLLAAVLLWFSSAVSHVAQGNEAQGKQQLEDALRRAAVSCYAAEGVYPPDVAYITEHYGIQINEEKYFIHYEPIAENLMPEIAVIDQEQ